MKIGVNQGSVLSPLLSSLCLKFYYESSALGSPGRTLIPMTLLSSLNCLRNVSGGYCTWKDAVKEKGLRVNAGKTKIMICSTGLDLMQSSGEFPCSVCRTGVGSNSIICNDCKHWVHKKCSGLKRLTKDPVYRCPQKEVQLEVVASLCYLGDMLSAAGGCELSTTTRLKTAWKKFKGLLSVLSSRHLSFKTRGRVYSSCVRSAILHASDR